MTDVNPGPSIASNPNSIAVLTPVNTQQYAGSYQGSDAIRLLGQARGVNANAVGDTIIPVINSTKWVVSTVLITNATTSAITAAFAGLFTATNAGGTTIVAAAVLTTLSTSSVIKYSAISATASTAAQTGANMYVNVGTTLAGTAATFDIYVLGYDLS
jgi:hypothetical protein